MARLIVLLALPLLIGCAAQDCSEYYSEEEFECGVLLAYDYGVADGLDACPPCPEPPDSTSRFSGVFGEALREAHEELADEIRALYR